MSATPPDRTDYLVAALALGVGLYFLFTAPAYGLWSAMGPGSGFMPSTLGGLAIFLAALLALRTRGLRARPSSTAPEERRRWLRPLLVLAAVVAYAALLDFLGFVLCNLLVLAYLPWLVGRVRPPVAVAFSALGTVAFYAIFIALLGVPLPVGPSFGPGG